MKYAASFLLYLLLATFQSPAQNKSISEIKIDYSFAGFRGSNSQFLVSLYKNRGQKPLADYYPEIIHWFASNKG